MTTLTYLDLPPDILPPPPRDPVGEYVAIMARRYALDDFAAAAVLGVALEVLRAGGSRASACCVARREAWQWAR
jgi:hypothetical protein